MATSNSVATVLPTPRQLNARLSKLSRAQVHLLADVSGVPFSTLYRRPPERDIMLSAAVEVLRHLDAVARLKMPSRADYATWSAAQREKLLASVK